MNIGYLTSMIRAIGKLINKKVVQFSFILKYDDQFLLQKGVKTKFLRKMNVFFYSIKF